MIAETIAEDVMEALVAVPGPYPFEYIEWFNDTSIRLEYEDGTSFIVTIEEE